MTITSDQLRAAVEQYLPTTVNYAADPDTGDIDKAAVFARVRQVLNVALALDAEAVFYLVHLAVQRLVEQVEETQAILTTLQDSDHLRAVTPEAPRGIASTQRLRAARFRVLQVKGSIRRQGSVGATAYAALQDDLMGFLQEEVHPNARNRALVARALREQAELLDAAWGASLAECASTFAVYDDFVEQDLATAAVAALLDDVTQRIVELEAQIAQASAGGALDVESLLVDVAAAVAALRIAGSPPSIAGTVTREIAADGSTEPDYRLIEGTALTKPPCIVDEGTGSLDILPLAAADSGVPVDDGDGDLTTPTYQDASADFVAAGIVAGHYLTVVVTGASYRITQVTETALEVAPEIPTGLSDGRYVVTEDVPGARFAAEAGSFMASYSGGATGTSALLSGTAGAFVRSETGGADGSNLRTRGSDGQVLAEFCAGSAGEVDSGADDTLFTDATAAFVTDGVSPGDVLHLDDGDPGDYTVSAVLSETELTIAETFSGTASGISWQVHQAGDVFVAPGAGLIAAGVAPGHTITVAGTDYTVSDLLSSTSLRITGTFPGALAAAEWCVPLDADEFTTAEALAADATYVLEIFGTGGALDGVYAIASVAGRVVTISEDFPVTGFDAVDWLVYEADGLTQQFVQTDEDLQAAGIAALMEDADGRWLTTRLLVGAAEYAVARVADTETLHVAGRAAPTAPGAWTLCLGSTTRTLRDSVNSPFGAHAPGDVVILNPGANNEAVSTIAEVVAADEVLLGAPVPADLGGVDYLVGTSVTSGMDLVVRGKRSQIREVINGTSLRVDPPLPLYVGVDVPYLVVPRGAGLTTRKLVDTSSVLTDDLVGCELQLMLGRPWRAVVEAVDGDELLLDREVPSGRREIPYRVLALAEGTAEMVRVPAVGAEVAAGDLLTIWGDGTAYTVASAPTGTGMPVTPQVPANYAGRTLITVRGGAQSYGRYLLLVHAYEALSLDTELAQLRLHLAEVLTDWGVDRTEVTVGDAGTVTPDGDADGVSPYFDAPAADFMAAGARAGDVLTAVLSVDGTPTPTETYVTEVASATRLEVAPELGEYPVITWVLERSSVSCALYECSRLEAQLTQLTGVLGGYTTPRCPAVENVLTLLSDQGMDRAADLLRSGDMEAFAALTENDTSYASAARTAVQEVGASTQDGTESSATSATAYSPSSGTSQEIDIRSSLSSGAEFLSGEDRTATAHSTSVDEMRNRAVYELTGEVTSSAVTDQDATLPWLAKTGSRSARMSARLAEMRAALEYIRDHPEEFESAEVS